MKVTRQEILDRLVKVQNHPFFHHQDILTITGFMTDEEMLSHAVRCINATYKHDEKAA